MMLFFFFQAEDGIRDYKVTGVQTCALPISAELKAEDHTDRPGFDYQNFDIDTWNSCERACAGDQDRKSTRLNSSHLVISYAVFCLKKKNTPSSKPRRERRRLIRSPPVYPLH